MSYCLSIDVVSDSQGRWVATAAGESPIRAYGSSPAEAPARVLQLAAVLLYPDILPDCASSIERVDPEKAKPHLFRGRSGPPKVREYCPPPAGPQCRPTSTREVPLLVLFSGQPKDISCRDPLPTDTGPPKPKGNGGAPMTPSIYVRLLRGAEPQLFILAILDRQNALLRYKTFQKPEQIREALNGILPPAEIERALCEAVQAEPV